MIQNSYMQSLYSNIVIKQLLPLLAIASYNLYIRSHPLIKSIVLATETCTCISKLLLASWLVSHIAIYSYTIASGYIGCSVG